jgi:peptide/nickel transport system substrate-binding protein
MTPSSSSSVPDSHPARSHGARRRRRPVALVAPAAGLTAILLAAGCSVANGTSSPTGSGSGGKVSTAIKVVEPDVPNSIDGCWTNQSDTGRIESGNVLEGLTKINFNNGQISPLLATSWKAASPTTWDFTLRSGVTFQNGKPFNAAAVAWWVNRVINPKAPCDVLDTALTPNVLSAKALSTNVVQITTKKPDPILPQRMTQVFIGAPQGNPMKAEKTPIGTGPYKFVSYSPGQSFVMKRYSGYWGKKPDVSQVTYLFRTESSVRADMAKTNEVDIATALGPADEHDPGAITYLTDEVMYYRLDTDIAPLNNLLLREAINYAINRKAYVNAEYGGKGKPAYSLIPQWSNGYNGTAFWPYNPAKAKKLIAEAAAQGAKVHTLIQVIGQVGEGDSNGTEWMDTTTAMLRAVGLNAQTATIASNNTRLDDIPYSPKYKPALVQNVGGNTLDDSSYTYDGKVLCGAVETLICNKTLNNMILAGEATPAGSARNAKFQAAEAYLAKNVVPFVTIAEEPDTMVIANPHLHYTPNSGSYEQVNIADITIAK